MSMTIHPPRYIVWSTDSVDLRDPFQKRWLLRQTLVYGLSEDIGKPDYLTQWFWDADER